MDSCSAIPIHLYHKGMKFYYPKTASTQTTIPFSYEYKQQSACPPGTIAGNVQYRDLADKTFEIAGIRMGRVTDVTNKIHTTDTIVLSDLNCTDTFFYILPLDAYETSRNQQDSSYLEDFTIRGAVFLDDVGFAQKLVNKKFYSLFPIRGKRFFPVTITKVEPGTWETPLLIHFKTDDIKDSVIYSNLCGTNVLNSFAEAFHFTKYFSCKDPGEGLKIPGEHWELIQQGKIKIGMEINEVELSLGKPVKATSSQTEDMELQEYFYQDHHLYFKNKKLYKIEQ